MRFLFAGVAAGMLLVPVELVALRSGSFDVIWTVVVLLLALGLAVGALVAAAELVIARFGLRKNSAALVRGATSMPAFAFVAHHLFDGGYAATLPGADLAVYWMPVLGGAAVAATCRGVHALLTRASSPRLARMLAAACGLGVVVVEYGNRSVFRGGYADVHAFLIVVSMALACVGVHLAARGIPVVDERLTPTPRRRLIAGALAGVLAINFVAVLELGLHNRASRWTIAIHGTDARHLTRLLRAAIDLDGDGYASILGGGDCDDTDSHINPGATDVPQNGIDEDCDGTDAQPLPEEVSVAARKHHARTLAEWVRSPGARAALSRTRKLNMIVILVDALRADILTDNAANRAAFPHLFALERESRFFTRAFSPAAGTDVSIPVLMTGEIVPFKRIDRTLIEGMDGAGMRTHAVLPSEVLRWAGKTLLTRGLDGYDRIVNDRVRRDYGGYSTSAAITNHALKFVDDTRDADPKQRWWMWLHYFDVHEHREIDSDDAQLRAVLGGKSPRGATNKYRATAMLVDRAVGRLRAELEKRGLWDRTIVALVSDHGESLGEDPRLPETHGNVLYNPLIHVPVMIRVPGLKPGRSDHPIRLMDLPPTLLALAGAEVPDDMDGRSLLPELLPGAPAALRRRVRPIVLNEAQQYGIILWPYKLLVRPAENLTELYDLSRDFAKANDLSSSDTARVRQLVQLYKSFPALKIDRSRKARIRREKLARRPH